MHIMLVHRRPGLSGQQAASRANLRAAGEKAESAEPFEQSSRRAATNVSSGGGEMFIQLWDSILLLGSRYKILLS